MFGYNEWERDACEPDWRSQQSELSSIVERLLGTLTPLEEKVLRYRFGLGVRDEYTLSTTAVFVGKNSVERVRAIEAKALRKLRHPRRAASLRSFVDPPKGEPKSFPVSSRHKALMQQQEEERIRAAEEERHEQHHAMLSDRIDSLISAYRRTKDVFARASIETRLKNTVCGYGCSIDFPPLEENGGGDGAR